MIRKSPVRIAAFTLIELLVVVAIIALLISILLPSLSDAKEQAKVAKCLSNLRGVMTTTNMYFHEYNDQFPFMVRASGGWMGICTWSYGGKTNNEYWETYDSGVFYIPVTERPFNEYLMGTKVEPDLMDGNEIILRTEIPAVECPSDRTSNQRRFNDTGLPQQSISTYDDVGTSYHYNIHALQDTNIDEWENDGAGWVQIGRALVGDTLGGMTGTLTMFWEDPLDWALEDMTQEIGNHKKYSKHCVGFLDGHAAYKYMDSRRHCGVGWATINPNWAFHPGQPRGAIYYTLLSKNCNP